MCGNYTIKFASLQTKHFGPSHHGSALAIKHFLLIIGMVQQHSSWSCSRPSSAGGNVTVTNEAATDSSNHAKEFKVHYHNHHLHAGNDQVAFFGFLLYSVHIYMCMYMHTHAHVHIQMVISEPFNILYQFSFLLILIAVSSGHENRMFPCSYCLTLKLLLCLVSRR